MAASSPIDQLKYAHQIASYASQLGVAICAEAERKTTEHLGAATADAILQAGVRYQTVVYPRVQRICLEFPEAATLSGLTSLLRHDTAHNFLLWKHHTKVRRFQNLVELLAHEHIEDTVALRDWMCRDASRNKLLALDGIGPKTFDYLGCLVGMDWIAVDRHITVFAGEAGVAARDYDTLRASVAFAADLLGIGRRDFDAWVWGTVSARTTTERLGPPQGRHDA